MMPESNIPLLSSIANITGTSTGITTSDYQGSVYPGTDWMTQLREKGLNPDLRYAWQKYIHSPLTHSSLAPLQRYRASNLTTEVTNYGLTIHDKAFDELARRGVEEGGRFNLTLDADVLEQTSARTLQQGDSAFIRGLDNINNTGINSGVLSRFFVNQYAGLSKEAANDPEYVERRFQNIKEQLPQQFDLRPVNTKPVDYHRVIDTIVEMGGNDFRNSLELGKIFPEATHFDEGAYTELKDWILYCKKKSISPNLCLSHFTSPSWFEGGWSNPDNIRNSTRCAMEVLSRLKSDSAFPDRILTQNEPQAIVSAGEVAGNWPPFHKSNLIAVGLAELFPDSRAGNNRGAMRYNDALANSVTAHIEMYDQIKELAPNTPVGFSYNLPMFEPFRQTPINGFLNNMIREGNSAWFKRLMKDSRRLGRIPADFVGFQYYNAFKISLLKQTLNDTAYAMKLPRSEDRLPNGWDRRPDGAIVQMLHVARWLMQTGIDIGSTNLPQIGISETGVPTNVDQTIGYGEYQVLAEAIKLGKDLIPNDVPFMWLWTLLDNLEWSSGYTPGFGILNNDWEHKARPTLPAARLSLASPALRTELSKHQITLGKYQDHLEGMLDSAGTATEKAQIKASIALINKKLDYTQNLEAHLPTKYIDI